MRSPSPAIFLMSVRICAFFGGMSFLHAFFSSNIDIRNVRLSSSNLKAFRSRPSREQLLTNLEPLFNKEFTVYQNTVESLRRTWKRIHEFDSSDGSDDSFTGMFSADGFQDEKEYSVVKELEVYFQDCTKFSQLPFTNAIFKPEDSSLTIRRKLTTSKKAPSSASNERLFVDEHDDEVVLAYTQKWVQYMIADFAVCPFTVQPLRAGIPRGHVRYTVSRATTLAGAMSAYWEEVAAMAFSTEKEISTVLLVFPELALFGENYRNFDDCTEILDLILEESNPIGLDKSINNVFFHPTYKFKDKDDQIQLVFDEAGNILGTSAEIAFPHDYARRSPWPIINILRTPMVQSAQKGIPEGRVFELNSQRLDAVGTVTLQDMLDRRDWTGLPQYSAFALNKGSKTSSGIKAGTEAGAGGGGEGDSDGDAEAEMDVRKGMEAYYRRSGSGGGSDVVKGVERRSTSDSGDDSDDDMSYRSPGRNVRFEEEIDVRREIGDMNNGYSLFDLNEQEEEEVEQEVEEGVEGEVDEDISDIQSSDISNFSNAVHEDQADGEETVIEEEDVYDSAAIEVGGEGEVEVEIEEEEDFSSLLSDVDKWLSEN